MLPESTHPVFFDCEASGLHGVVIEIAWAFVDGTGEIVSEAYLVKPVDDWDIEAVWDEAAEAMHHLTIGQLRSHGKPVCDIAARMNGALSGRELYSDSPFDEAWALQIFDAAGMEPTFTLRRLDADQLVAQAAAQRGYDLRRYREVREVALAVLAHRAEPDARAWAELWHLVVK
jgi:hypothetical protein